MARLRLTQVAAPGNGVNEEFPDTLIPDQQTPRLQNIRVRGGVVGKRTGFSLIGSNESNSTTSANPLLMSEFIRLSGNITTMAATETNLYNWTGTAFNSILGSMIGDIGGFRSADSLNDIWLFTNGIDHVKKWTGTGSASDLLGGDDYQTPVYHIANAINVFQNRVHLFGTNEDGTDLPYRVRWSELNKSDEWNEAEGGGFRDLLDDPTGVQGAVVLGNWNIIYCGNSIWVEQFVGGTVVNVFNRVVTGTGTSAPRTIIDLGNFHIFMGDDDIYRFDGQQIIGIGGKIRDELFASVSKDNFKYCHSVLNRDDHLMYLYVPFGTGTVVNKIYVYDYQQDTWVIDTALDISAAGAVTIGTIGTIDDLSGVDTIDEMPNQTIDSLGGTAGRRFLVTSDTDGINYKDDGVALDDNGVAIDGSWESKDFVLDPKYLTQLKRMLEILHESRGSEVTVAYSVDHGESWTDIESQTLDTTNWQRYRHAVDINSRHIRLRFRNNNSNEQFFLRWIGIQWMPAGEY